MKTRSIDLLTRKLKNAPESVLERVIGYVDALVETTTNTKPYSLSKEQQQILDSQLNSDKTTYNDADILFDDLKSKYEL
jgi:hypothetical protein